MKVHINIKSNTWGCKIKH